MHHAKPNLSINEIARAFEGDLARQFGPILSTKQLAQLLGHSPKTIYGWVAAGRFDGSFQKRGKHMRFWRDRAVALFFNGKHWETNKK